MSATPAVIVVIACYNEAEILETSFAEIQDTLGQMGRPFEIVFVDDVSRDRTREIIRDLIKREFGVTYTLQGLGKLLGHHCLSLSAIVANRITKEFSKNGDATVARLITETLRIVEGI